MPHACRFPTAKKLINNFVDAGEWTEKEQEERITVTRVADEVLTSRNRN